MERSNRGGEAGRVWHVCWQAAVGRDLLGSAALVSRIRTRLLGAHQAPGRALLYYLLLPREIHLLSLLPPGDSVASFVNGVSNTIARRVRQADGVLGVVFQDQYQAHPLHGDEALRRELRILAWRPVSAGACATPTSYAHAALRTILGLNMAQGFHAETLLARLGGTVPQGRAALRQVLAAAPSELEMLQWELCKGLVCARGVADAAGAVARQVKGAAAALVAASAARTIDGALGLLERWVATRLGLNPSASLADMPGRQASRARALVACLALKARLCPASYVAHRFGRVRSTLSEQMTALRDRPADRAILRTPMDQIVREALALEMARTQGRRRP